MNVEFFCGIFQFNPQLPLPQQPPDSQEGADEFFELEELAPIDTNGIDINFLW
ncbi:MAG: hypothetical protein NTX44_09255 [Ignavibacteriales bacterium]|nr:hypothetical protein [Ignavibacteriales bacterium]